MRFFILLLLLWVGVANGQSRELLLVIGFPQKYDYVPNFDDTVLQESLNDYKGKRLILVGGGDRILSGDDSTISSSLANLQLQRSESLRLARRRAVWVRSRLVDMGFNPLDLQLGILTQSIDDSVTWGGIVEIYAIGK